MTLKIHLEYVRICMSQHTLCICPYVENDKSEGGGGLGAKVYIYFSEGLFTGSPKVLTSKAIRVTRKKLLWKKSEM